MRVKKILVFGASGHAKVVIDAIEKGGAFSVLGLVESFKPAGTEFFGHSVLGSEEDLPAIMKAHDVSDIVIAVGDNWSRHLVHEKIRGIAPACGFPNVIHPSLQVSKGAAIGEGTVVAGGVTVNSDARIGSFCIVDAQTNIGHDAVIGDFASLAPNSSLGGYVRVGPYSALGMGTNVIGKVEVGPHAVLGAGSTVVEDIPGHVVAYGTPARVKRKRGINDPYL